MEGRGLVLMTDVVRGRWLFRRRGWRVVCRACPGGWRSSWSTRLGALRFADWHRFLHTDSVVPWRLGEVVQEDCHG